MNKTAKIVKSAFTFGIFLMVIGIVGKFFQWKQADILIGIGILFELFALLALIWNHIKENKKRKS